MASTQSTWTSYGDLLDTLKPNLQPILEKAVCAYLCGRHEEASKLFDDLEQQARQPIVFLERSEMFRRRGMYYDVVEAISQALEALAQCKHTESASEKNVIGYLKDCCG